jgi:hypothetical protein
MFAVVRHYHFNKKDSKEIDRLVSEEFVPLIKKAKGFVRYYWLDTGSGEGASFSVFKDKAGADESVRLAAEFVKNNLSKYMMQKPEVIEGPIKAHD